MPVSSITDLTDIRTFEAVFRENYALMVNFARQYVADPDEAEGIVQATFSGIWEKAEKIRIQGTVKSYLFGAVRNACLNFLKHERVKHAFASHQMLTGGRYVNEDPLEYEELKSHIAKALDKLPEKCRRIFEMSRYEDKKYQEIADELELSLKTVENQMGKALKILRQEMTDYLFFIFLFIHYGGKF